MPAKTKMMKLENSLSGKPVRVVERLGYTSRQYQTALKKVDQKYGSEKRLLQRHLEAILRASPVEETNLKELEIFSDRVTDVVAKLENIDQHQELAGVSFHRGAIKVTRVSSYRAPRVVVQESQEGWTIRIFKMVTEASCLSYGRRGS